MVYELKYRDADIFLKITIAVVIALVAGFPPIIVYSALGVSMAVVAVFADSVALGAVALVPLGLFSYPHLVPPVFAAAGVIVFAMEKRQGYFIKTSIMAGAIFAGFILFGWVSGGDSNPGLAVTALMSLAAGATVALGDYMPLKGQWRMPAKTVIAALAIYGAWQFRASNIIFAENWLIGLALSGSLAFMALMARRIDLAGAFGGVVAGVVSYVTLGTGGFVILAAFVIFSEIATYVSRNRAEKPFDFKRDEPDGRGLYNVAANMGPAMLFALVALFCDDPFVFTVGFCASLGGALADTVSGELGRVYGGKTVDIHTLAPARPGANGAISMVGVEVGIASALLIGGGAVLLKITSIGGAVAIFAGALAGNLADSFLGSILENKGLLTNSQVNFWAMLSAGLVGAYIALML